MVLRRIICDTKHRDYTNLVQLKNALGGRYEVAT